MKFVMAIKKHDKTSIGRAEGHNARQHPTASQLPQRVWITKQGRHTVTPWREDVLASAKALAKRKDAVVAVEIVLQVGNQADWREMPTEACPEGKPMAGAGPRLKALHRAAQEAVEREFGAENVVSIELHTDESSPHVHAVVVPVHQGKLQAKHWLDGAASCARLRERLHASVNKHLKCEYTKGEPGGSPHDQAKRAGGPGARRPAPEPEGWVEKVKGLIDKSDEVKRLKAGLAELGQELEKTKQDLAKVFSQLKASIKRAEAAEGRTKTAEALLDTERRRSKSLESEVERLRPKLEPKPEPKPKRVDPGFGAALAAIRERPDPELPHSKPRGP